MAGRSLKASLESIERAKRALNRSNLTQKALAQELGLARSTVSNFFRRIPVDRLNFEEISRRLGFEWQEIVDTPTGEPEQAAVEEMASPNSDFVGHEEAIADSTPENSLDALLHKARLLQVSPDTSKQVEQALDRTPSVIHERKVRRSERLKLLEKANKGNLKWTEEERLRTLKKELPLQDKKFLLSKATKLSIQQIDNFFSSSPVDKQIFIKLCSNLKLEWQKIADIDFVKVLVLAVPQVRSQRSMRIRQLCGKLQVLYVSRPIELDQLYVDVNILNEPPSYQWLDFSELPQVYNPQTHEFDRLGLGEVSQPRVPGLLAVESHHNLMILGKPGSGKSTFLKHIALYCNQGKLEAERVPIFIGIKSFSDEAKNADRLNLLDYISEEFVISGITEPKLIEKILEHGRAMILLDGLDEVAKEDGDEVVKCINTFCKKYSKNKFIITCRIAAQKYRFLNFQDIELADFNLEQVGIFAKNWFMAVDRNSEQDAIAKANQFIEQLKYPENQQLQAIAVTPILLTLTCLAFQRKLQFPSNRTSLYKRGIETLLIKWDESRGVKRHEVYRNLSVEHKIELLTQVAANTFENSRYFFKKEEILEEIAEYIQSLITTKSAPATLRQDSREVLESIEAQHGLLVERAQEIYSFSHLTFQEYFTANKFKKLVDSFDDRINKLLSNITDNRWQEVFSLIVDMPWKAEQLMFLKQGIDEIIFINNNDELQDFLLWLKQKSNSVQAPYKPGTVRAFYFTLAFNTTIQSPNLSRTLDLAFVCAVDNKFAHDLNLASNPADALKLANTPDFAIDLNLSHKLNIVRAAAPIDSLSLSNKCDFNPKLKQRLIQLGSQLPELHDRDEDEDYKVTDYDEITEQESWWKLNGRDWIKQLRDVLVEHRNIGQNWQFSDKHTEEVLRQYYYGNKLLANCLNSASKAKTITPEVRAHIEDTLLLPMDEIREIEKHRGMQ